MFLPNPDRAFVDPSKVRDYLLAQEHSRGGSKSVVFASVGYRRDHWDVLQADLVRIAGTPGALLKATTQHGRKFVLPANLQAPSGRVLSVLTVWVVRWKEDFPRFVTAYPGVRR